MDEITREPTTIRAEDINPRYNWGRALPALGIMGVDFEERVDYRRLHRYRLGRVKQALEKSELGALLVFDVNNIRYMHLDQDRRMGARQALPLGAAHAHQRRSDPVGLRLGGRAPQALHAVAQARELQGRPDRPARHRQSGVRPDGAPRQGNRVAAQGSRRRQDAGRRRHHRAADDVRAAKGRAESRRRPAGDAGSARDQIGRRDRAAQPRRRDGRRRLSPDPRAAEARRARERHRRRGEQVPLHARLRRRRSDQRHFRRALQSASAQFHRPHVPARRSGVLRHPAILHGLPHLLLPHLQCRPRDAGAARRLQEGARVARSRHRPDQARRVRPTRCAACGRRRRISASPTR
jgi:hypothetical protein